MLSFKRVHKSCLCWPVEHLGLSNLSMKFYMLMNKILKTRTAGAYGPFVLAPVEGMRALRAPCQVRVIFLKLCFTCLTFFITFFLLLFCYFFVTFLYFFCYFFCYFFVTFCYFFLTLFFFKFDFFLKLLKLFFKTFCYFFILFFKTFLKLFFTFLYFF